MLASSASKQSQGSMEELLEGQPEEDDVHLEQALTILGAKAMSGSFKVLLEVRARSWRGRKEHNKGRN